MSQREHSSRRRSDARFLKQLGGIAEIVFRRGGTGVCLGFRAGRIIRNRPDGKLPDDSSGVVCIDDSEQLAQIGVWMRFLNSERISAARLIEVEVGTGCRN